MRDGNNGENFYGKVASVKTDTAGVCIMTVSTTADYLQDITKTTLPSNGGKIVIGNTEYHFSYCDYEKDADCNLTGNYLFTMTEIIPFLIVCPLVFLAGLVDSMAGGGGLISLPAYIFAGLPMHAAVATNKLSAGQITLERVEDNA